MDKYIKPAIVEIELETAYCKEGLLKNSIQDDPQVDDTPVDGFN